MRIDSEFDVAAPPADVYALMLDPRRVAPCIPGAEITGAREDGGFEAQVTVKVGPIKMAYRGSVAITAHDDAARTAAMRARGAELRGQGNVDATMSMAVTERPDGSHVSVSTQMAVTGRVAQMGQGIMQDVATRMITEMAHNMEAMLAAPAAAEPSGTAAPAVPPAKQLEPRPIKGLSVIFAVMWGRIKRLFARQPGS